MDFNLKKHLSLKNSRDQIKIARFSFSELVNNMIHSLSLKTFYSSEIVFVECLLHNTSVVFPLFVIKYVIFVKLQ